MASHLKIWRRIAWAALVLILAGQLHAQTNAWQRTDKYVPPDFNAYFPEDTTAGQRLDELERSGKFDSLPPEEMIDAMRQGFRTARSYHLSLLRSFGNRFIWGKTPQNAAAIELMYHAAGYPVEPDPQSTRHYAVYFGMSVVEPKTPNILHTLVDLSMRDDDPNLLNRVAWGVKSQREECLAYLRPSLNATSQPVQEKARIVEQIISGKLQAFAWATERARQRARVKFTDELPAIKQTLETGSSSERREVLQKIMRERIELIMDDSFIKAFATCTKDADPGVRNEATIIAGNNWVWRAGKQHPDAIELMLQLSQDEDRQVRYNAVYYGLSTTREKSDAVVHRMVEMAVKYPVSDISGRIAWGLQNEKDRKRARRELAAYTGDSNPQIAEAAKQLLAAFDKEARR